MRTLALIGTALILVGFGGYLCGKSKVKTQIVYERAEEIKNVAQKRAKIQSAPNARRDELLELMRSGRL